MLRKASTPDSPSPSKKRKIESTPVKRSLEFFFRKQAAKTPPGSIVPDGDDPPLFVQSDGEDEQDRKRQKQEEEDEKLARELQEAERRMEVDDELFARRLASDYDSVDQESNNKPKEEGKDVNQDGDSLKDEGQILDLGQSEVPPPENPTVPLPQPGTLAFDNSDSRTSLEEIYAIPLDKDPLDFEPGVDAACATNWLPQKTPYAFLTHAFILINSTRSRLKIVDYLVNALRVVMYHDPASLLPLVWLTTNAIAPPYEGIELNLGGSVISKALASASGLTPSALKALYNKHGDIGDVAFEAKMAVRTLIAPNPLTVKGVYSMLRKIAGAKGQGSAEAKRQIVERLLVSAKGEEVRYIGRTLVQNVLSGFLLSC
jgi:DNA ligase 1